MSPTAPYSFARQFFLSSFLSAEVYIPPLQTSISWGETVLVILQPNERKKRRKKKDGHGEISRSLHEMEIDEADEDEEERGKAEREEKDTEATSVVLVDDTLRLPSRLF